MRLLIAVLATLYATPVLAQECTPTLGPEQIERRKEGVRLTRAINNLQANQRGGRDGRYLRQEDLATSPFAAQQTGASAEYVKKLNFTRGEEVLPGWELTLDLTSDGYWFMIKDKQDGCGRAFVSNQRGVIFEAQPLR